jgi:hypothetical protein
LGDRLENLGVATGACPGDGSSLLAVTVGPFVMAVPQPPRGQLLEVRHERFDRVRLRLERAGEAGQLEAGTDVDLLVEALVSPIFFRAFVRGGPLDDEFLATVVDRFVVKARR